MFDVLTYQKGAGVLRMLERYLGADGSATACACISTRTASATPRRRTCGSPSKRASGQPVRDIMDTWILQGGFPLVSVGVADAPDGAAGGGAVTIEPGALLAMPPRGPRAPSGRTGACRSSPAPWAGAKYARCCGPRRDVVSVGDSAGTAVVVNAGGSGYYRVRYAPEHLHALAQHISTLEVLERFNLLGDTWAVVVARRAGLAEFLVLAEALGEEGDPDVWAQVTGALSFLDHAVDDDLRPRLAAYTRALLAPVLARTGWDPTPGGGRPHRHAPGPDRSARSAPSAGRRRPRRGGSAFRRRRGRTGGARPRPHRGDPRRRGGVRRRTGLRELPGALPASGHAPGGAALPLLPGRVPRPLTRRPGLRARPDARCARRTRPS